MESLAISLKIAVAASFTAEPVLGTLAFWMKELGLNAAIEFAPYNQVFQELLNPASLLSQNHGGMNVILLRPEDWLRFNPGAKNPEKARVLLERNARDFIETLHAAISRAGTPHLVALCPVAPPILIDPSRRSLLESIEERIVAGLEQVGGVTVIGPNHFAAYPVDVAYDPQRDALGHIPYTPLFFAAMGTLLARRIHALKSPPYKVIVLDCDNTIWQGIVGEEGAMGVTMPPSCQTLQQFVVEQVAKGFLVCLCSKNEERDVLEVLERRTDMPLKREHLVAWRINWVPKSENIRSLAQELNLGLDGFVFIDDNPVECAEVRANCPEVLTLQLPPADDVGRFLSHLWAFDRLKVTSEDRQRTAMYRRNAERSRVQRQAQDFQEFLRELALRVEITAPTPVQLDRVAQLTQRTNQFNFTTIRRTESEIRQLAEMELECRIVEMCDRFGDYGLVGVLIYGMGAESLPIDTFLLSCRVLGRGVEHHMLNYLGDTAQKRGLDSVVATVIPTGKNLPARQFLDSVAVAFKKDFEGKAVYRIPAEFAARTAPSSGGVKAEVADDPGPSSPSLTAGFPSRIVPPYERIASILHRPDQVLLQLDVQGRKRRERPSLGQPFSPPSTEIERRLSELWAELLRLETVGVRDNYFDLGGTSLLAVDLFARIENLLGITLPLTTLVEAPTIAELIGLMEEKHARDSLVPIRKGGNKPAIFLVHDGDGETMLYRNLALRLDPDHPIYGLQPHSHSKHPILHTRIEEMAAYHIEKMRTVQPQGPYFIGGMCAGGVIAYAIARQLQSQSETVGMVALIDAADVVAEEIPWRFANQRLRSFSTVVDQSDGLSVLQRAVVIVGKATKKAKNFSTYLVWKHAGDLWAKLRMRLFRYFLDRRLEPPRFLEHIPVRTVYLFAEKSYRPSGVFEGELILFRATEGENNDEPYINRYSDPLFGWGRRASQGVRAYDVPGGHSSMLQEPNVQVLAGHMQAIIEKALIRKTADQHTATATVP
ncbi:MAG: HAD-IIIC family phosphatase [Isosphaeraceae bacterium]